MVGSNDEDVVNRLHILQDMHICPPDSGLPVQKHNPDSGGIHVVPMSVRSTYVFGADQHDCW